MGQKIEEMQKISNPKSKLLLYYYVFQKKIKKYLTDWKDKKDGHKIEKGYIIDPDYIKEWKRISDYDNIKTNYLDHFGLETIKINDDQKLLITQHLQPVIKDYEQKLIYYVKKDDFYVCNSFFSLEYLQNLCDVKTYNLFETNGEIEKVEYIFKQKMLIIFFRARNVIKIILFNEKNNNIINLKFLYNYNDRLDYNKDVSFFERKSSEQILNYISETNIFNLKKYKLHNSKTNRLIYKLFYEEENNKSNNLNTGNPNNGNVLTNNNNTITNNTITNNIITNNNKSNNTDTNNSNSKLNNTITQSENSLSETIKNDTEISQSLNENKTKKEDSELKKENDDNCQKRKTFLESNNVIAVNFITGDNRINKPMACKTNYTFKSIEEKLYREYPEIKDDKTYFIVNGTPINRETTFEDNKIKDGDNILICFKSFDTPCD